MHTIPSRGNKINRWKQRRAIIEHFFRLLYTDESSHKFIPQAKKIFNLEYSELINGSKMIKACTLLHSLKYKDEQTTIQLTEGYWQKTLTEVMNSNNNDQLYSSIFSLSRGTIERLKPKNKPIVEFFYIIWGDEFYFNTLSEFGLSSLISSIDYELIREKYHVRFYVYTLPENRNKVVDIHQKAGGYDELIINTEILSQSDSPIEMRGFCYLDAYCSAEQDCFKSFQFGPDLIFGNGIFQMLEKCPIGGASAGGLIRHSRNGALDYQRSGELKKIFKNKNRNSILASLALKEWSIPFQRYYYDPINPDQFNHSVDEGNLVLPQITSPTYVLNPSPGLILESIRYVSIRYNNVLPDIFTQLFDHDVPRMLENKGLKFVPDTHLDFLCCEPSTDGGYYPNEKVLFLNPFRDKKLTPSINHLKSLTWRISIEEENSKEKMTR